MRCVMLDVDGVLVTGRPEDGRSWATDIEHDLGIPLDRLQSDFFVPHWGAIVTGRTQLTDVLAGCLPDLATGVSVSDFLDYWFARDARLDDAVLDACGNLRAQGVSVYLATNQEHERARYLMDRLGLGAHVDGIVYSAAVGAKKPDRAFFDAALAQSGATAGNTLLVDDTRANIDAAHAAGWHAALWLPGSDLSALAEMFLTEAT